MPEDFDIDTFDGYDSGPFCRHWIDPIDCEELCFNCGHKCTRHLFGGDKHCEEPGCGCSGWVDKK